MKYYLIPILVVCVVPLGCVQATFAVDQTVGKSAIEKAIKSYTAAFNARDAESLAKHWGPEAIYINPLTSHEVEGRAAIAKEFAAVFAELKETKLAVDVESIEFISPGVAVEVGVAKLTSQTGDLQESRYTAIHVKHDGKWLLDRVTEEDAEEQEPLMLSHYDQLRDLEWMIGSWVDAGDGNQIKTTCQWTRNNNFIVRAFKVVVEDRIETSGIQVIGWDPAQRKIRSWAFDSDGGFAEGTWTKSKNRWLVNSNSTLPDGKKGSSINIMTLVDEDTVGWQSTGREVDGNILPNIAEVVITRQAMTE